MNRSVTWIFPDKLGGVTNLAADLLAYREPDGLSYHAVLTRNLSDPDDVSDGDLRADVRRMSYSSPPENLHSVINRLAAQVPAGPGVIVANDWLSLALASAHPTGKAVAYVNHGDYDYYYDLAVRHQAAIDVFLTATRRIYEQLRALLPGRLHDILCIPYGVEIPQRKRRQPMERIRLLYVGRLDRSKGVLDLPAIDRALVDRGISAEWTIIGPGPAEAELKAAWGIAPRVSYRGRATHMEVKQQYSEHDVLVMPSRAEGLPLALLEAMASGCVPVVSDLPSGIPEIVENGVTGYRIPPADISGFGQAIAALHNDRSTLASMAEEAAGRIESGYNIIHRAPQYQQALTDAAELTPRWSSSRFWYGSRLDKSWIPNLVVKSARSLRGTLAQLGRNPHHPDERHDPDSSTSERNERTAG